MEKYRPWIPVILAIIGFATAAFQYQGKSEAETGKAVAESANEVLITQRKELIKSYEEKSREHNEESKRYLAIISFLDSSLRAKH